MHQSRKPTSRGVRRGFGRARKSVVQHEPLHGHKGGRGWDDKSVCARCNGRACVWSGRLHGTNDSLLFQRGEDRHGVNGIEYLVRGHGGRAGGRETRTVAAMTGDPLAPGHVGVDIRNLSCSQYQLYLAIENSRRHCSWMPSFQTSNTLETMPSHTTMG